MKHTLPTKTFYLFMLLFAALQSFAQLPAFTLTVTPTPQSCLGNGSLSFAVAGNNPAASMDYTVYLLPNITTPVVVTTNTTVGGLVAGTYRVVATQSQNGQSNTSQADAVIANNVVSLAYTLTPTMVRCGNDGKIQVNVTSGNAVSYQIIAGPVIVGPQASSLFNNLPAGTYQVKVTDNCGEALVVTLQLIQQTTQIFIDQAIPATELETCDQIEIVNNFFSTGTGVIFFPVTMVYTVYPPGGGTPTVVTTVVPSGSNVENMIGVNIPFYNNQAYSYNLTITDACGNVFTLSNNVINTKFDADMTQAEENCNRFLTLGVACFVAPYTVTFNSAPAGFNPSLYNPQHPTFSEAPVSYGSSANPVPDGLYSFTVTDACGRSVTKQVSVAPSIKVPVFEADADGCTGMGSIFIGIADRVIVSVIMTVAPVGFPEQLPYDVSAYIGNETFLMDELMYGSYTFFVTDNCGATYTVIVDLQPESDAPLSVLQRAGCADGEGSLRITPPEASTLVSVTITAAPAAFTQPLPYTASVNLSNSGVFYMNSLPEGNYTFETVDSCNIQRTQTVAVAGYQTYANTVNFIQYCGSFDVQLQHASSGDYIASYWLQKYDPITNTWSNPEGTGTPYVDGTQPTSQNAKLLNNNSININNAYTGLFRVLKVYYVFSNASSINFRCTRVLQTYDTNVTPQITDAFSFPCANNLTEVAVVASGGVAPLTYTIISKNGDTSFTVNNGTSNVFSELEPASYNFRVIDFCGNAVNRIFDVNGLEPIEITVDGFCEGEDTTLSVPEFSFLTYKWYKQGAPNTVLSTTGTLVIEDFDSGTDAGTYFVSIMTSNPDSCMNQVLEQTLNANALPEAGGDNTAALCNDGTTVNLADYLVAPYNEGGAWEEVTTTGAVTGSIFAMSGLAEGNYQFRYKVNGMCDLEDEALITLQLKAIPQAPVLSPVAPVCQGSDVQLSAAFVTGAAYQWTGPNGFTSTVQEPLLTAAGLSAAGNYTATVTVNGCTSPIAMVAVAVNPNPQFVISGNTLLCEGQTSVLTVEGANFNAGTADVDWFLEGELITGTSGAGITINHTGTYTAAVTVNNCFAQRDIEVNPNQNAFAVTLEAGCVNEEYVISIANIDELPGASFVWTGPGIFTSNEAEVVITNGPTGEYSVVVTNADGCTATASIPVTNTHCNIPKGISPNGDGKNDSFDLSNLEIKEIKIFNRYGLQVYHANDYLSEWHGQSDKGTLPTGTYFYVATLSAGKQVTGWVYLQREIN
jgi:gliding motility-associated-like protein